MDREFYSGISNDMDQFLVNMNWYKDTDILTCFKLSKKYHGLVESSYIKEDDFELIYLEFKWEGSTYYPIESDETNGEPIRVYKIYDNKKEND